MLGLSTVLPCTNTPKVISTPGTFHKSAQMSELRVGFGVEDTMAEMGAIAGLERMECKEAKRHILQMETHFGHLYIWDQF